MDVLRKVYTELSLRLASTRMLKSGEHFPLTGKFSRCITTLKSLRSATRQLDDAVSKQANLFKLRVVYGPRGILNGVVILNTTLNQGLSRP